MSSGWKTGGDGLSCKWKERDLHMNPSSSNSGPSHLLLKILKEIELRLNKTRLDKHRQVWTRLDKFRND